MNELVSLFDAARFAEVEDRTCALLKRHPDSGFAWKALGVSLQAQGRDGVSALRRATELLADDAEVHHNLGIILRDRGQHDDAAACFRRALRIRPDFAQAHNNLGSILHAHGQVDDAAASYRLALTHRPDFAQAHSNLGLIQYARGELGEAVASYRRALALQPDFAPAHNNLGNALKDLGQLDEAATSFRRALAIQPDFAHAHSNLGTVLHLRGQLVEAAASLRRALALQPGLVQAHGNLSQVLRDMGQLEEAEASCRRALAIQPDFALAHSNLLFCLGHRAAIDAKELLAEHCRFAEQFEAPLRSQWPRHGNLRDPERRLRIGFVSGDLRTHAVANFIEPVLARLALQPRLSLHAYYSHIIEDEVTQRLKAHLEHWHPVARLSDEALARCIREDGIDILVDLSGHTAHNRLLSFARKPAPVQVSWIGYPNTTGLRAIDYVLCDRFNAPHGLHEPYYVEKFARLASSGCFVAQSEVPEVNELPALSRGHVTFGSFNRPEKLGEQVLAAWAAVLRAVPSAIMLLGNVSHASLAQHLTRRFGELGIAAERLTFRPRVPLHDYLELHHEVDLVLDTWPYSGGTTTHYALCMGVPVVTLLGPLRAHCQSAAVLGRTGLQDWVARDVDEFVRTSVRWGQALPELAQLRAGLRARWQNAPLQQPATVARSIELAFRHMWRHWCAGLPAEHFEIEQEAVPGSSDSTST
jgi:protein O-GlcNAc transferase